MTNEQIIFHEAQELAKAGKIAFTGRVYAKEGPDGQEIVIRETEPIHTYQMWKELGYQVQKGQKAVTKLLIWKHTSKTNEETGEESSKMFMKTAAFFSRSQVAEIEEEEKDVQTV